MTKKKILLIGRVFSNDRGVSGPSSIIMSLVNEFKADNVDFELLGYDSDKISKVQYFLLLFRKLLFSRDLIVNVHTEGFLIPFIVYLISRLNRKNDYYLTVHGIYIIQTKYTNMPVKAVTRHQEKVLIKNFPNIICVSEMLRKDIIRLFNRTSKVFVANNGIYNEEIEFRETSLNDGNVRLIAAGGIKRIKGIFESLELVQYINSKSNEIKVSLDIYGGFDDEQTVEAVKTLVKEKNLESFVSYNGIINDKKELYEKYTKAHFNLALSHYDTFNAAILESMACGTPAIASPNCGASYLISNYVDGFVIDLNESFKENIYEIIKGYTSDSESYNKVRRNAYKLSRQYSWDRAAKNYLKILYNEKDND